MACRVLCKEDGGGRDLVALPPLSPVLLVDGSCCSSPPPSPPPPSPPPPSPPGYKSSSSSLSAAKKSEAKQQVLALPAPEVSAEARSYAMTQLLRRTELIDALPYADADSWSHSESGVQSLVKQMIAEEAERSELSVAEIRHKLEESAAGLDALATSSTLLQKEKVDMDEELEKEIERLETKMRKRKRRQDQSSENTDVDSDHITRPLGNCNPPDEATTEAVIAAAETNPSTSEMESLCSEWQRAVRAAKVRLEIARSELIDLSLSLKHGASLWRAHNANLEAYAARAAEKVEELENQLRSMLASRQQEQMQFATREYEKKREVKLMEDKLEIMEKEIKKMEEQLDNNGRQDNSKA